MVLENEDENLSMVDVGLHKSVSIDHKLEAGVRVTVKFPPSAKSFKSMKGTVVSPDEPRTKGGLYWGYTVRVANSLSEVHNSFLCSDLLNHLDIHFRFYKVIDSKKDTITSLVLQIKENVWRIPKN